MVSIMVSVINFCLCVRVFTSWLWFLGTCHICSSQLLMHLMFIHELLYARKTYPIVCTVQHSLVMDWCLTTACQEQNRHRSTLQWPDYLASFPDIHAKRQGAEAWERGYRLLVLLPAAGCTCLQLSPTWVNINTWLNAWLNSFGTQGCITCCHTPSQIFPSTVLLQMWV